MRSIFIILAIAVAVASNNASADKYETYQKLQKTCDFWKSKYRARKSSTNRTLMNDACKRADDYGVSNFNKASDFKYQAKQSRNARIVKTPKKTKASKKHSKIRRAKSGRSAQEIENSKR